MPPHTMTHLRFHTQREEESVGVCACVWKSLLREADAA